jgi:hypothetical protein
MPYYRSQGRITVHPVPAPISTMKIKAKVLMKRAITIDYII